MGIEYSTKKQIPFKLCYLFGPPNLMLTYNTQNDEFKKIQLNIQLLKNMAIVQINDTNVILSGGVDSNYSQISSAVYKFKIDEQIFINLPSMNIPRYTHQILYDSNNLYVMGGRSYGQGQEGILDQCEKYDYSKGVWQMIAPMKHKRATFFSLLFQGKIYVFGGYTDIRKRSKTIECYNGVEWNVLDLKLQYGVETGIIAQNENNEILILGGQSQEGIISQHQVINILENKCYIADSCNQKPRVLQKGIQIDNYVIQMFGVNETTLEKGNLNSDFQLIELKNNKILNEIGFQELLDFTLADYTFELGIKRNYINEWITILQQDRIIKINKYLFTQQNLLKNFDLKKNSNLIQESSIVSKQILYFMGGVQLKDKSIILIGGVNSQMNFISNKVIKISPSLDQTQELKPLNQPRYAFSYLLLNHYIYVVGGRYYGNDNDGILDSCERYNIHTNCWEQINKLNEKRCSALIMNHQNLILVGGGFNSQKTRLSSIELYDQENNIWNMIGVTLKFPLEACVSIHYSRENKLEFITFGGREVKDTQNVIQYRIDFDLPLDIQNGQCDILEQLEEPGSLLQKFQLENFLIIIGQNQNQQLYINQYEFGNFKKVKSESSSTILNIFQLLKIQNLGKMLIID